MVKKTLKLSGLHCASCCMVIEGELEDIGVKSKCDFVKQAAEVEYDPAVTSDKKITQTIEKQGYKVIG